MESEGESLLTDFLNLVFDSTGKGSFTQWKTIIVIHLYDD